MRDLAAFLLVFAGLLLFGYTAVVLMTFDGRSLVALGMLALGITIFQPRQPD